MKSLYILAAVILLGAFAPRSMAQMRVVELAYEASPSALRLPTSATGELTMQACATCKVLRLRATDATRYVIGGEQVTLAEMTGYLKRNPDASLVVMQLKDTTDLSRLVVHVPKRAQ
jgi:hypothetical protein